MRRLEAVIAHRAGGRESKMHERCPAFQLVMTVAVKKKGCANGSSGGRRFDGGEGQMIVHHIVGKENLLSAPLARIQGGKIVQRARGSDPRE